MREINTNIRKLEPSDIIPYLDTLFEGHKNQGIESFWQWFNDGADTHDPRWFVFAKLYADYVSREVSK